MSSPSDLGVEKMGPLVVPRKRKAPSDIYRRSGLRYRTSKYMLKARSMPTPRKPRNTNTADKDSLPTNWLGLRNSTQYSRPVGVALLDNSHKTVPA